MQTLVRSETLGVTGYGGRGTAGAGPGRDFIMVAEEYLPPTAAPGTWALMSPAEGRRGFRSRSPSSRRRTGKPEKNNNAQNGEPLQDSG